MHPWHDLSPGENPPEIVDTLVEIPRGGHVKYELDKRSGLLRMDRVLFAAMHYPANYGFIPQTFAEDDDPLDVLVLCQNRVEPMTLIASRPIGMMVMTDENKADHKIVAVAVGDPSQNSYRELGDLPEYELEVVQTFFEDYKTQEKDKVEVDGFRDRQAAHEVIEAAIERYHENMNQLRKAAA